MLIADYSKLNSDHLNTLNARDTGLALLHANHCPVPVYADAKNPYGTSWGLRVWTPENWPDFYDSHPNFNIGILLGKRSGVVDFEVDGPEGEDILASAFGGELPTEALGWHSSRGPHYLFLWDDRLAKFNKTILKFGPNGDLEIRIGCSDPEAPKQLQSVIPPSIADGFRRNWFGAGIAKIPDAFFAFVERETSKGIQSPAQASHVQKAAYTASSATSSATSSASLAVSLYVRKAFEAELSKLESATEGSRNEQLNRSAFCLGQLVGAKVLDRTEVEDALATVAHRIGLSAKETLLTIRSGLDAGSADPRDLHHVGQSTGVVRVGINNTDGSGRTPGEDDGDDGESESFNRTDLGNARRLVYTHGHDIRYCGAWGRWLVYQHGVWVTDETSIVDRLAMDVIHRMHLEAAAEPDPDIRKPMLSWAMACEAEKRINSMVSLARKRPGIPVTPNDLNTNPWFLNCWNGTIDLRTGHLLPHIRDHLITKQARAPFDPDADCPTWMTFVRRVMAGDDEMIGFLQRVVGYALTAVTTEQALFFLYGRGRNGKSTFLSTVQHILNDYATTINSDILTIKRGEEHPTGIADLDGKRFVATIEIEDGKRLAESLVKSLTGDDMVKARRMRQDFYEFRPVHKLFLAANHKPVIKGTDDAIWRRIKLIPFNVQIPPEEVDRTLPEKLKAESPGILAWAVRGCLDWQSSGLKYPEQVLAAVSDYRAEMDVLADFLDEKCEQSTAFRVKSSDLYRTYVDWCKDTGTNPLSMRRFSLSLNERGVEAEKSGSKCWRIGIRLRETNEDRENAF